MIARADTPLFAPEDQAALLVERQVDGKWAYAVGREADGVIGVETATLTNQDTSGIASYYRDTIHLSEELFAQHDTAEVYVLFNNPVLEDKLPAVIREAPQQVKSYALELLDAQGQPFYTAAIRNPKSRVLVNYEELHQNVIRRLPLPSAATGSDESGYSITGFTHIVMSVNREQYHQLLDAPEVLAVDIGPAIALMEAGLGTHSSDRISFGYAISHLRPEERTYLETRK